MILETKDLFIMQDALDTRIFEQHHITREETHRRRMLALLVEVGELANETRCFKFWSTKASSEKGVVLEEYVDGIHFLLSLGIDLQECPAQVASRSAADNPSEAFMDIYELTCRLRNETTIENYETLFSTYLGLGELLGFDNEDIRNSYFAKNKENFHRQDINY